MVYLGFILDMMLLCIRQPAQGIVCAVEETALVFSVPDRLTSDMFFSWVLLTNKELIWHLPTKFRYIVSQYWDGWFHVGKGALEDNGLVSWQAMQLSSELEISLSSTGYHEGPQSVILRDTIPLCFACSIFIASGHAAAGIMALKPQMRLPRYIESSECFFWNGMKIVSESW